MNEFRQSGRAGPPPQPPNTSEESDYAIEREIREALRQQALEPFGE
jgi:hypothetical protein